MAAQYGYASYYKPPQTGLAQAAAAKDPYGLAPNNRSGPLGIGSGTGFAAPPKPTATPYTQAQVNASLKANPQAAGYNGNLFGYSGPPIMVPPVSPPTAAAVNSYDLSTDPALQQVQKLAGLNDQQAQSGALAQREQLLLAYGDPKLASSVLGATDPIVQAAGQNPTSTVAQLGQQRDRNLKSLDDQLQAANLGYSGYRVTQETQAGQDFQNALAQAAAQVQGNLGQVDSSLAAALAQNNATRAQGINDAADRAAQAATQTGTDPGALAGAAGGAGPDGSAPASPPVGGATANKNSFDPVTQAIINAGLQRRQGFLNFGLRDGGMA